MDGLPGSEVARLRLRLILETIAGDRSVGEACAALGIGEAAFHKLRSRFLEQSVDLLEPRPAGRPASSSPADGSGQGALEAEIGQLQMDLQAARVRAELALAMPHVVQPAAPASKKGVSAASEARPRRRHRRRARRHARQLWRIWRGRSRPTGRRRGCRWQRDRREAERDVRKHVVSYCRWARRHGMRRSEAARHLGLSGRLVAAWERRWRTDRLSPHPRGRPLGRSGVDLRNAVIRTIDMMGPGTGLERLRPLFPGVARRELTDLLDRYRAIYCRRHRPLVHTLQWRRPGAVWAMDYTDPPHPIDGVYEQILLVRDLASGQQLLALPVPRESAWQTTAALTSLFLEHGPPLVVKSDNGSTLRAARVRSPLEASGVLPLVSPPRTPTYNGSCEAGIGQMKTRAHHLAARRGYPGEWTCSDVEGARLMGNQTARPHGLKGPSPDQVWAQRRPLTQDERRDFQERVLAEWRRDPKSTIDLSEACDTLVWGERPGAAARRAITRALHQLGYLVTRRNPITLPIRNALRIKIT